MARKVSSPLTSSKNARAGSVPPPLLLTCACRDASVVSSVVHRTDLGTRPELSCDSPRSVVDCLLGGRMSQRRKSRSHRHSVAVAGSSGSVPASAQALALHSADFHAAPRAPVVTDGSFWGRRRVLLLNSTFEPLTALPMRRAV